MKKKHVETLSYLVGFSAIAFPLGYGAYVVPPFGPQLEDEVVLESFLEGLKPAIDDCNTSESSILELDCDSIKVQYDLKSKELSDLVYSEGYLAEKETWSREKKAIGEKGLGAFGILALLSFGLFYHSNYKMVD